MSPRLLLGLGLIFIFTGWIIPLLIIMRVVPSSFLLNFISWGTSVSGLFIGFIGGAMLVRINKE